MKPEKSLVEVEDFLSEIQGSEGSEAPPPPPPSDPTPEPTPDPVTENKTGKPAPLYFSIVIFILVGVLYLVGALDSLDAEKLRPPMAIVSLILFLTGIHKDGWRSTIAAVLVVLSILFLLK